MTRADILKLYPNASESTIRANLDLMAGANRPNTNKIVLKESLLQGVSRGNSHSSGHQLTGVDAANRKERKDSTPLHIRAGVSTDEAKLNKTERARLAYLSRLSHVRHLHTQGLTLKLAHDCRLTPDFFYFDENEERFIAEDVKGFQREDALIKMKVAARMFPEFSFQIVFKNKSDWTIKPVKP